MSGTKSPAIFTSLELSRVAIKALESEYDACFIVGVARN